jgi:copper chaperone NosL
MMAKGSRVAILVASLALGLMYVLPVWTIDLEAPQYPEGIGMVIRINTIEGQKEHDLKNINGLNHYIGMREIVPESIPELSMMPKIVAVLMVLGCLVALLGRRKLLYGWTIIFVAISLVGMADFWKWEYDYGHNLDEENAIIKIPGMSYQPPLIGSRQILNFKAHSWPGGGGLAAILAGATAVGIAAAEFRRGRRKKEKSGGGDQARHAGVTPLVGGLAVLLTLAASACSEPEPRPLAAGSDRCESCLMTVDASGHGAELVTRTGKIYAFDSAECLANYLLRSVEDEVVHSTWVTDFSNPGELVETGDAYFLVSNTLKSPMGLGITAFARAEDRDGAVHSFGGVAMDWAAVQQLVGEAWPDGRPQGGHGGHSSTLEGVSG